jgi:hypothetical protein
MSASPLFFVGTKAKHLCLNVRMGTATKRCFPWVVTLALLATGVVLAWTVLFGINLHGRFQAESLVAAVHSMQVGTSTLEEVRPMMARYRTHVASSFVAKQYAADTGFYVGLGNKYIARMGERFYFLRYVGLAPWGAGAEIYFRNERICELRLSVSIETKKVERHREGFDLSTEESFPANNDFVISGGHVTGGSRYIFFRVHKIMLPGDATSAERTHAFAYDLSCVSRLGSCQGVSQVLDLKAIKQDWDRRHPG